MHCQQTREMAVTKDSKDQTVKDVEAESKAHDDMVAERAEEAAKVAEAREPDDEMASPAMVRKAPPADPAFAEREASELDRRLEAGEPLYPEDSAEDDASVE